MPKASPIQNTFSGGEISPLAQGRTDNERYKFSVDTCLNWIPTIQGALVPRAGTKYAGTVKDSTKPPRLVRFEFSITQAYVLEIGDQYIRFWANGGQVQTTQTTYTVQSLLTPYLQKNISVRFDNTIRAGESAVSITSVAAGVAFEVVTPFAYVDLPLLKFNQSGDTLYITHPSYPTYKLTRQAQTQWTLTQIQFLDGPYLPINTNAYQVQPPMPADLFNPQTAISIYPIPDPTLFSGVAYAITGATSSGGLIRLSVPTAHLHFSNGQQIYVTGVGGTWEANNNRATTLWTIANLTTGGGVGGADTIDLVGSTFINAYTSGGTIQAIALQAYGNLSMASAPCSSIRSCTNFGGLIRITTIQPHGLQSGQKVIVAGVQGTTEANNTGGNPYWIATNAGLNTLELVGSAFVHAFTQSGTIQPYFFASTDLGRSIRVQEGAKWGWGVATLVTDGGLISYYVPQFFGATEGIVNFNAKNIWRMGKWSSSTGFPGASTFHQDRLCLVGAANYPQDIDCSKSGDYENMAPTSVADGSVAADNALSFTLNTNDVNAARWVASDEKGLVVGSVAGEHTIRPSNLNEALSPTNIKADQSSKFGCANVEPVQAGKGTLYLQRAARKLRELYYFFQVDGFRSTDLTELADHVSLPTFTQLAVQKETLPLIWAVRADGLLASLSYSRDDLTLHAGWARHQLGGYGDVSRSAPSVTNIACIPSPDTTFDQMWMVVKRTLNLATVYTIEYMNKVFDSATAPEDAYFLDCGSTYDNPITVQGIGNANPTLVFTPGAHGLSNGDRIRLSDVVGFTTSQTDRTSQANGKTFLVGGAGTNFFELLDANGNHIDSTGFSAYVSGGKIRKMITTISGLTWLKNETVSVVTDGAVHRDVVVDNSGQITLDWPAAKVQVGFNYNSDLKLLRLDAGSATGSSMGKTRRAYRYSMMLYRAGGLKVGMSFDDMFPMQFTRADVDQLDQATALYTGFKSDTLAANYDFENQICVRRYQPLPAIIQSITQMLEEFDR